MNEPIKTHAMNNRKSYKLTREIAQNLIPEAIKVAFSVETDQLDCAASFARQQTDKTPAEVFDICLDDDSSHWAFIYHDNYFAPEIDNYFDVGCSTLGKQPNYFLWIKLSPENGFKLAEKFGLKEA